MWIGPVSAYVLQDEVEAKCDDRLPEPGRHLLLGICGSAVLMSERISSMRCLRGVVAFWLGLALLLPGPFAFGQQPNEERSAEVTVSPSTAVASHAEPCDVALRPGGMLLGQAVDFQGCPLAGVEVVLCMTGCRVAVARADDSGYFLVRGLRGGVYEIAAGPAFGVFRLWATDTAPPTAQAGALVAATSQGIRANDPVGKSPISYWLDKPVVVAGVVAAAVAIPLAVHSNREKRSASP